MLCTTSGVAETKPCLPPSQSGMHQQCNPNLEHVVRGVTTIFPEFVLNPRQHYAKMTVYAFINVVSIRGEMASV